MIGPLNVGTAARLVSMLLLSLALLLAMNGASAQPAGSNQLPNQPVVAQESQGVTSLEMVGKLFAAIQSGIQSLASNSWATTMGKKIAAVLCALVISWTVVKNWVMGKGFMSMLGDILPATVMAGLAIFAMEANLGQLISASVNKVATSVAPGSGSDGLTIMAALAQSAFSVFDLTPVQMPGMTDIGGWIMILIGYAAKLVAAVIILGSGAVAAGSYILADVSVAIATGLGPVLYVWAIWKPTEFLFNGWLKFLLTAAFQKLIVAFMASLVGSVVGSIGAMSPLLRNSTADFIAYAGLMLIGFVSAYLMTKAPEIGRGLISGAGGLSLSGWSHSGQGSTSNTANAASKIDRGAGAAINGAVNAGQAMRNAFRGDSGGKGSSSSANSSSPRTASGHVGSMASGAVMGAASVAGKAVRSATSGGRSTSSGGQSAMSFPPIVPPAN